MASNITFIHTFYYPSFQESLRLENLQRDIAGWRAELAREWHLRKFNAGEIYLSKTRFHNGIRNKWQVINGGKLELRLLTYNSN